MKTRPSVLEISLVVYCAIEYTTTPSLHLPPSLQHNYLREESFAILNNDKYNFMKDYNRDDFKTFRKRMIGIILATDMARHVSDLTSF